MEQRVAQCYLSYQPLEVQIFLLELELKTLYVGLEVEGEILSDLWVVGVRVHCAALGAEARARSGLLQERVVGDLALQTVHPATPGLEVMELLVDSRCDLLKE